jgi:antirestriction protein ArdC
MVGNARAKRPAQCGDQSALLGLQRHPALVDARPRLANAALCHVQASARGRRHVRKGEHGTKVYFVKQLRVRAAEGKDDERLVPMLREYTVFNVAQCEGLPASIIDGKPARVRNPDTRDPLADEFLAATRDVIREGAGEAYYAPGQDFISLPAFAAFRGADHFYNVAFHELAHYAGFQIMPISVSTEPDAVASGSTEAA